MDKACTQHIRLSVWGGREQPEIKWGNEERPPHRYRIMACSDLRDKINYLALKLIMNVFLQNKNNRLMGERRFNWEV